MDKIQELTSKLYSEGIEKGRVEADKIVEDAKAYAQKLMDDATAEAQSIVATARKEAAETKENTQSELRLYTSQAVEALKTEITNVVTGQLVTMNVKAAMEDTTFIQKLIVDMVQSWSKNESLTIGTANAEALEKYIAGNAKTLLDKKLKIESVNGLKAGFVLSPADGSYKVEFGEEEFIQYFKEFLRPQIQKLLF